MLLALQTSLVKSFFSDHSHRIRWVLATRQDLKLNISLLNLMLFLQVFLNFPLVALRMLEISDASENFRFSGGG